MHPSPRFAGWVVSAVFAAILLTGCGASPERFAAQAAPPSASATPASPAPAQAAHSFFPITPTPFRPLAPTPMVSLEIFAVPTPTAPGKTVVLVPMPGWQNEVQPPVVEGGAAAGSGAPDHLTEGSAQEPTFDFYGIDFGSPQRVTIEIIPLDAQVNKGKPIKISFMPGERCEFGDRHACTYAYKPTNTGNVIVVTVHSGMGGEAQRFRAALEGTGINRAGYPLKKVNANLQSLAGAAVVISQGEHVVESVQMTAVTRIPARALKRYFRASLAEILEVAADLDPGIGGLVDPDQPQIVLETCGWKMPGEDGSENVSDTTGSVYLGIIR